MVGEDDPEGARWDWQALEDELDRREGGDAREGVAEEEDDIIITSFDYNNGIDQYDNDEDEEEEDCIIIRKCDDNDNVVHNSSKSKRSTTQQQKRGGSVDAENASIDAVIRKVAMLRAPLKYDEPDLDAPTAAELNQRWLKVAMGAIEFERRRTQKQQQQQRQPIGTVTDDAPRDVSPPSGVVSVRADKVVLVGTTPKSNGRRDDDVPVEKRDDDETSLRRSARRAQEEARASSRARSRPKAAGQEPVEAAVPVFSMNRAKAHKSDTREVAPTDIKTPDEVFDDYVREQDRLDQVESSRHEEPKQSDYVYLQIEKRNTSGDDDMSVSSMEYLFNWLSCVNPEEELKQRKRLVEPATKAKKGSKKGSGPSGANTAENSKDIKVKHIKAAPSSPSAAGRRRSASADPRKRSASRPRRDEGAPSRQQASPQRRRKLVEPQYSLNYRPSLQRNSRSSGTINTLSTSQRITNIIDRTDAWLQIGPVIEGTSLAIDEDDDGLDGGATGEEVQLSPKRKPTLQVPPDESVRYHPTLSGRVPSATTNTRKSKGNRVSGRTRKGKD